MRTRRSPIAAAILALALLGAGAQARAQAPAPAPRSAAAPPAPSAAGAEKPSGDALAQEAEAKPKEPEDKDEKGDKKSAKKYQPLTGNLAAGLTLTHGNSNTSSLNLAFALQYDPRTKNVVKADGFYLENREDKASTIDRTSAHLRDEHSWRPRWFAFGDAQLLRDRFKEIDYLLSPTVGVGTYFVKTPERELSADLGAGAVVEKDRGLERTTSGAVRAGEGCRWKIGKAASFTESAFALWKTRDTADAYYHVEAALGAAITEHTELKVALIDEYKQKPPDPAIRKNDLAAIVAFGYKL